jgi:hypothetical protein
VLIAATPSQCYSRCGQQQCTCSSGSCSLKVEVEVEEQTGDVGDRRGQAHDPPWQLHRVALLTGYLPLDTINFTPSTASLAFTTLLTRHELHRLRILEMRFHP